MQWPDNVKNSIFWYLWKIQIKDVNQQYSNKFKDTTDEYDDSNFDRRIIFRMITGGHKFLYKLNGTYLRHELPLKYWFSSGLNNPNGYK